MMSDPMWVISWSLVAVAWFSWLYPLLFRAPHKQDRPSVTLAGATRAGLLLQGLGIVLAFVFRMPLETQPGVARVALAIVVWIVSAAMSWTSVTHLGRQFRISAGLYDDHQLVSTGPYRFVRHPIYTSMLGMLICSILLLMTEWEWTAVSLAFYIAGTEIRVRAEDGLLRSRFGDNFETYRKAVPGYLPFVR
jgi:protein-S-isoprenylcysteine O-methyltransferase Ste14